MPIDRNEAEQRLAANPLNVDAETRATLVAVHGEEGFRKLRQQVANNRAADIKVSAYAPAPATPQPTPTHVPASAAPGSWEDTLARAEYEFLSNPVGASSATRALLRRTWGEQVYSQRLRSAVLASGQANMKVTK